MSLAPRDIQITSEGVRFESSEGGYWGSLNPSQARALALEILVRWPDPVPLVSTAPSARRSRGRPGVDVAVLVQAAVNPILERLQAALNERHPEIKSGVGVSSGGDTVCFHYLEIRWPGATEALVIGINVARSGRDILITADVCGEDTGEIHLEQPSITLGPEADDFLVAESARRALQNLCGRIIESQILAEPPK